MGLAVLVVARTDTAGLPLVVRPQLLTTSLPLAVAPERNLPTDKDASKRDQIQLPAKACACDHAAAPGGLAESTGCAGSTRSTQMLRALTETP